MEKHCCSTCGWQHSGLVNSCPVFANRPAKGPECVEWHCLNIICDCLMMYPQSVVSWIPKGLLLVS